MRTFLILLLTTALWANNTASRYGIEENISAIVGNDVILSTEVDMALLVQTDGKFPSDSATFQKMRRKVLDGLIEDKLLLEAARIESVVVDSAQVNKLFEERWGKIREQFVTEEALQKAIAQEGYAVDAFKRNLRKQIRENLLKQNFIYTHFGEPELTPSELDSFYDVYKDSLPEKPGYIDLQVIVLHPESDTFLVNSLLLAAGEARAGLSKLGNGSANEVADRLSTKYPSLTIEAGGPESFNRGDLTDALDKAAFSTPIGEWSQPIIAPTGVYVIRPNKRDESSVIVDYIRVSSATGVDARFKERAMEIYSRLVAHPDSFDSFVRLYSDDTTTARKGGSLGRFSTSELDPHIKQYIPDAKKGDILPPWIESNEIDIFKVADISAGHKLTLEDDRDIIENIAKNEKLTRLVRKYLKRIRRKIFVKVTGR